MTVNTPCSLFTWVLHAHAHIYMYAHHVVLQVKCHQYWPEVGGMTMGDISINLIEIQDLAYYTIRTFHVSKVYTYKGCGQWSHMTSCDHCIYSSRVWSVESHDVIITSELSIN